ncbi:hypothetical protein GCM10009605_21770 [Nocardiopsis composta]
MSTRSSGWAAAKPASASERYPSGVLRNFFTLVSLVVRESAVVRVASQAARPPRAKRRGAPLTPVHSVG